MYRLLFMTLLVFAAGINAVDAQFKKGMLMPGLSIGSGFFNSGETEYTAPPPTGGYISNTNSLGIELVPSIGWFISEQTVIGGRILTSYRYQKYLDESNNVSFRKKEERNFSGGLGVFARNYFKTTGSFIPFGQVNVDGGIASTTTEGYSYTSTLKETYRGKSSSDFFLRGGISLGVTKLFTENIGLDISAGYTYSYQKQQFKIDSERDIDFDGTVDETGVTDLSNKTNNHGFMLSVGLQVFLSRR